MRTIPAFAALVVCAMTFSSCSKESETSTPAARSETSSGQVLNVTINTDEPYTVAYQKETELNIYKQAMHYKESLTSVNSETGQIIYKYVPSEGFKGTDEVTLSTVKMVADNTSGCYRGNYGNQQNVTLIKSYTTIKINIK